MKNDKSLLSLEKKLENSSTEERILTKFKFKPDFDVSDLKKGSSSTLGNIQEFLQNFKKSNDELLSDNKALQQFNIEIKEESNDSKKDKQYIQLNLGLGILEPKENNKEKEENKDNVLKKVIASKNQELQDDFTSPYFDNDMDQQIIKFLLENKNKSKSLRKKKITNRIHFIKK